MTPRLTLPPATNQVVTILRDEDLSEILQFNYDEFTVVDVSGAASTHKVGTSITLVDGTLWNPSLMREGVMPVVCRICRNPLKTWFAVQEPARHGLLAAANAQRCEECGVICCPRHRHRGDDGCWYCVSCRSPNGWRALLRAFFFKKMDA